MPPTLAQNKALDSRSSIGNYYSQVIALTPKETVPESQIPEGVENTPLTILFSPFLLYGSVILFFSFFLGALIIQIINKSLDRKRTLTTLVVAFVVASIPVTLKTALQVTSLQSQAGPDEVPRNITVVQKTADSFVITWDTQSEKFGSVRVGKSPFNIRDSRVIIADKGKKTDKHTAIIKDLDVGVAYDIEILSGSTWYNDNGKPLTIHTAGP